MTTRQTNETGKPGAHLRLVLALAVNLFIPGIGNLIFVGLEAGTIVCTILCLWVWAGGNHQAIFCWMIFMGLKAAADLYVIPAHRQKIEAAHKPLLDRESLQGQDAGGFFPGAAGSRRERSSMDEIAAASYFEQSLPVAHVNHPRPHDNLTDKAGPAHPPADKQAEPVLHDQNLPEEPTLSKRKAWSPTAHAASAHPSLNTANPAGPLISSHAQPDLMHSGEALSPDSSSAHTQPHLLHPADPLAHDSGTATAQAHLLHPADPLAHDSGTATAQAHLLHHADPIAHDSSSAHAQPHLLHPADPLAHDSGTSTAQAHQLEEHGGSDYRANEATGDAQAASDSGEDPVIYDIYGEEDDDDRTSSVSPFENGLFHDLSADGNSGSSAPNSGDSGSAAQPVQIDPHSHHLKQMNYGLIEHADKQQQGSHKKRQQLCPTCQKPREHNRPTCPACGTHFEEGCI